MFDINKSYLVANDVFSQKLEEETVILDMKSEVYFCLDEVGTKIWIMIGEGKTPRNIIKKLEDEYSVDTNVLREDTEKFFQDLISKSLIKTR